jgi:hypothetical protein
MHAATLEFLAASTWTGIVGTDLLAGSLHGLGHAAQFLLMVRERILAMQKSHFEITAHTMMVAGWPANDIKADCEAPQDIRQDSITQASSIGLSK